MPLTAKELREKTDQELAQQEQELRKQLFETRYKHATRQLENTGSISHLRRDLARVMTVRTERVQKTEKK